ncbi:hypothetical protein D3C81_1867270 [compost metagenome]
MGPRDRISQPYTSPVFKSIMGWVSTVRFSMRIISFSSTCCMAKCAGRFLAAAAIA